MSSFMAFIKLCIVIGVCECKKSILPLASSAIAEMEWRLLLFHFVLFQLVFRGLAVVLLALLLMAPVISVMSAVPCISGFSDMSAAPVMSGMFHLGRAVIRM